MSLNIKLLTVDYNCFKKC